MVNISDIAREVKNSPIRKMFNIASTMSDVISFTVGEPDFVTPQNIIDAAQKALQEGQTKYTLNAGIMPLRKVIAKKFATNHAYSVDPETEIIVTSGGLEALYLCLLVLVNPGDEVIISDPGWTNYHGQIQMCGGIPRPVKVYEEDGFIFNIDHLKSAINEKTKAVIINSPSNPTGGVANRETLEAIAKIAIEHDLIVISDEVYQDFLYDDAEFVSIADFNGMKERTVIIDSFSKSYAMTGWRVGSATGPEEIIKSMIKYQENVIGCVNTAAQYAAIEALEGPQDSLKYMIQKYAERRKLLLDGIDQIDRISCVKPKGAFYAFVNIEKTGKKSEEFALELLKSTGVVVVPGSGFGEAGEGFIRMSYATSENNILEGLRRIKQYVETIHS